MDAALDAFIRSGDYLIREYAASRLVLAADLHFEPATDYSPACIHLNIQYLSIGRGNLLEAQTLTSSCALGYTLNPPEVTRKLLGELLPSGSRIARPLFQVTLGVDPDPTG
jgi:hypothetical protein